MGTGTRAKVLERPLAGKTGTTMKSRTAWFIGFTLSGHRHLLSAMTSPGPWAGEKPVPWRRFPFMSINAETALEAYAPEEFTAPESIIFSNVDGRSLPFMPGYSARYALWHYEDDYYYYDEQLPEWGEGRLIDPMLPCMAKICCARCSKNKGGGGAAFFPFNPPGSLPRWPGPFPRRVFPYELYGQWPPPELIWINWKKMPCR